MAYIKISIPLLMKFSDYLPLEQKLKFVLENADFCFDKVEVLSEDGAPVSPSYVENSGRKSRFLMGAFVKHYLGAEFEHEPVSEYLMTEAEYNNYASSHIFNQIERLKQIDRTNPNSAEARIKAFDVLTDFKDLEKRFNTEVYALGQIHNDVVTRIVSTINAQTSSEYIDALKAQLADVKNGFSEYVESSKAGALR